MPIRLTNALLVDLDPPQVAAGELRVDRGTILARSPSLPPAAGDEVVDCGGRVVLPGLVNGHTHLYSALAVGMPPPPETPRNFHEILKFVWWRLDQALDADAIARSAEIGALDALRCGTTTLIDHHASPSQIDGSLDLIEAALDTVGLRGVLCYETTDRHGPAGCAAGLSENRRYAEKCRARRDGRFAGLIGAHASFTLNDESLARLAALAAELESGVHIHVAEDPCDELDARQRHAGQLASGSDPAALGQALLDRLDRHGLLHPSTLLAHGTHLGPQAVARLNQAGLTLAHNARSNMNNAVGYAPVAQVHAPVMLGTDGIGGDMLAEARAAWFISRDRHAGLTPNQIIAMLANAARRASLALGVTLGRLTPGAAADLVITDYRPATPLTTGNLPGHVLFGLAARHVRHVLINGEWALRDGQAARCDESALRTAASAAAAKLWDRMRHIPA